MNLRKISTLLVFLACLALALPAFAADAAVAEKPIAAERMALEDDITAYAHYGIVMPETFDAENAPEGAIYVWIYTLDNGYWIACPADMLADLGALNSKAVLVAFPEGGVMDAAASVRFPVEVEAVRVVGDAFSGPLTDVGEGYVTFVAGVNAQVLEDSPEITCDVREDTVVLGELAMDGDVCVIVDAEDGHALLMTPSNG